MDCLHDVDSSCHIGYYWAYHCPLHNTVPFDYQPGRSAMAAARILKDFKGYLQTDGYAVYDKIGAREGVTRLNCWTHARRGNKLHNTGTYLPGNFFPTRNILSRNKPHSCIKAFYLFWRRKRLLLLALLLLLRR